MVNVFYKNFNEKMNTMGEKAQENWAEFKKDAQEWMNEFNEKFNKED